MIVILITVGSILALTFAVVGFNRFKLLPRSICPICAGVSGTWLWMLAGTFTDFIPTSDFRLPTSILMGGSVVGIAYQLEKRLPSGRSPLVWKSLFIPFGFALVYGVVMRQWGVSAGFALILAGVCGWAFGNAVASGTPNGKHRVKEIEEKMNNCC